MQNITASLSSVVTCALSMRYFYSQSATDLRQFSCPNEIYHYSKTYATVGIDSLIFGEQLPPTTPIPCRSISSLGADDWDVALCIISV